VAQRFQCCDKAFLFVRALVLRKTFPRIHDDAGGTVEERRFSAASGLDNDRALALKENLDFGWRSASSAAIKRFYSYGL
jgi:hypothetical protein